MLDKLYTSQTVKDAQCVFWATLLSVKSPICSTNNSTTVNQLIKHGISQHPMINVIFYPRGKEYSAKRLLEEYLTLFFFKMGKGKMTAISHYYRLGNSSHLSHRMTGINAL